MPLHCEPLVDTWLPVRPFQAASADLEPTQLTEGSTEWLFTDVDISLRGCETQNQGCWVGVKSEPIELKHVVVSGNGNMSKSDASFDFASFLCPLPSSLFPLSSFLFPHSSGATAGCLWLRGLRSSGASFAAMACERGILGQLPYGSIEPSK